MGRFRTGPPADSKQPLRIAFYSCQEYQPGFYNAQAAMAKEDVDLVLCLGDYIYESDYTEGVRTDTTGINHDGHVETLPEYWQKYRLYKSDPDLKAMHAAHNFISVWDDHEVEDNYADGLPSPHAQPEQDQRRLPAPRAVRRSASRPATSPASTTCRVIRFEGDRDRIYDALPIGGARRPGPHRPAPVPRPAALQRRHGAALRRRGQPEPDDARRDAEGLVQERAEELAARPGSSGAPR